MSHPSGSQDFSAEYALGLRAGLRQAQPFLGRDGVVSFPEGATSHGRVLTYEQRLLRTLTACYQRLDDARTFERNTRQELARWERKLAGRLDAEPASILDAWKRRNAIRRIKLEIDASRRENQEDVKRIGRAQADLEWSYTELAQVRQWLDEFVAAARHYSLEQRPKLRRTPEPQPAPSNAQVFPSHEDFMEGNLVRVEDRGFGQMGLSGDQYGYRWNWRDYDRPWVVTRWALHFIEDSGELFAAQLSPQTQVDWHWDGPSIRIDRPVWLFQPTFWAAEKRAWWEGPDQVEEWLTRLRADLEESPDSLLALADAIQHPPTTVTTR